MATPSMVVFMETDTEDDRESAGLVIFRTIARIWWASHSHKQHTKLRTEDNGRNTRGCPSVLTGNCIAMTPEKKEVRVRARWVNSHANAGKRKISETLLIPRPVSVPSYPYLFLVFLQIKLAGF